MTRLPPKPTELSIILPTVDVPIESLIRLSAYPATEPFWAKNAAHRFDDSAPPPRFGVLYAAEALDCAFCESIIHENSLFNPSLNLFEVPLSEFNRSKTYFTHAKASHLRVADLTGQNLKRLGLNGDLVAGNDYAVSQEWAHAVHCANNAIMGIRYPSRQLPGAFCYAIFERSGIALSKHEELSAVERVQLCLQFNAVPV